MITRMEMTYRSKEPCQIKPQIFSTGGYQFSYGEGSLAFDFEDMEAACRFENDGYLYIDVLQKNIDIALRTV